MTVRVLWGPKENLLDEYAVAAPGLGIRVTFLCREVGILREKKLPANGFISRTIPHVIFEDSWFLCCCHFPHPRIIEAMRKTPVVGRVSPTPTREGH